MICYERHRVWMPFRMTLPLGLSRAPQALILERMQESDFMFLTESGPIIDYPWDRELRAMLPRTRAWCDAHLRKVGTYEIFGRRIVLYERPVTRRRPLPRASAPPPDLRTRRERGG